VPRFFSGEKIYVGCCKLSGTRMKRACNSTEEYRSGAFTIRIDPAQLEVEMVHAYLRQCYWAEGIPKGVAVRSIENSLCFGVFDDGKQVGVARVISDFATYPYLADVFVPESHRGKFTRLADDSVHNA
jgi:hypothetical protein